MVKRSRRACEEKTGGDGTSVTDVKNGLLIYETWRGEGRERERSYE